MSPQPFDTLPPLLFSGAMHYFRSTPSMWPSLMQKSREAGLNAVETITFWGAHEPQRGNYDFSGRLDLRRWCETAHEAGLGVILRPGPYTCAEINFGGFPAWLRDVAGVQFRTRNQPYYDEVRRWMEKLFEEIQPMLATNGGPIFMVQVENEYKNIAATYGEEGHAYLEWLRDLIAECAPGLPLSVCNPVQVPLNGVGWVEGTLETLNSGCAHQLVAPFQERYPGAPCLWTEAWTGWYQVFGGPQRRRSATNMAFYAARFFASGGRGINYYMWHGGTNFGRSTMYLQVPSYDFDAPLNEFGQITPKSALLSSLHHILWEYRAALLLTDVPEIVALEGGCAAYRYSHPTEPLVFLCNDGYIDMGAPSCDVEWEGQSYHLPPETVIVLGTKGILWQTSVSNLPDPKWYEWHECETQPVWQQSLATPVPLFNEEEAAFDTLREQLQFTQDCCDYAWYRTRFTSEHAGEVDLTIDGVADVFQVFVDGQRVAVSQQHLLEDRGAFDDANFRQTVRFALEAGTHDLSILVGALGLVKGDWMIRANMALERKGIWGRVLLNERELDGPWQVTAFDPTPDQHHSALPAVAEQPAWHHFSFGRVTGDGPLALDLKSMTKGMAWLNGKCLTRYWLVPVQETTPAHLEHDQLSSSSVQEASQRYYHIPQDWLQDNNEVVLWEELGGNPEGVRICCHHAVGAENRETK